VTVQVLMVQGDWEVSEAQSHFPTLSSQSLFLNSCWHVGSGLVLSFIGGLKSVQK
jgi:hypothetical protein